MERLKINIVQTIFKLEMIFPLLLFDSIENLAIHLSFEAKFEGLV